MKHIFLIGFLFAFFKSEAQKEYKTQGDFIIQPLSRKKGSKKKSNNAKIYIPIDYDFTDSVSIFFDNIFLSSTPLKYIEPDSAISYFPYNRVLLSFERKKRKGKCLIKLHTNNRIVLFKINKQYIFYHLEISKKLKTWNLAMLNSLPWPN